jgi:hypothetical protein
VSALLAFDALLSVLESQGKRFDSYEDLEAYLAREGERLGDLDEQIAACEVTTTRVEV